MNDQDENLYHLPETGLNQEELFTPFVNVGNLLIERIISSGQSTPEKEWYDQDRDEWVVLIQGRSSIRFYDEEIVNLESGDHIYIPAHRKHRVESTSTDPVCIWLAVHWK